MPVTRFSLADQWAAQRLWLGSTYAGPPPLPAADASIVIDIGTTALAPKNVWSSPPSGWALRGTGGTVSDTDGFIPGTGTGRFAPADSTYLHNAVSPLRGTVYCRLQRRALSIDKSRSSGSSFFPGEGSLAGGNSATGSEEALAWSLYGETANEFLGLAMSSTTASFKIFKGSYLSRPWTINNNASATYKDATYIDTVFTWDNDQYWGYVDGQLVCGGSLGATWDNVGGAKLGGWATIGNNAAGPGAFGRALGAFAILRWQWSTSYFPPPVLPVMIGAYGDSTVVSSGGMAADALSLSVAAVNAQQLSTRSQIAGGSVGSDDAKGQNKWLATLQQYAQAQLGAYFQTYVAAQSGRGWATTGMTNDNATNTNGIDSFALGGGGAKTTFSDALNAARPEIILTYGSVNDVANGTPTALLADMKARFDYWANNNPALRKIIFFEMFAWDRGWSGTTLARSVTQRAAVRAEFGNAVNEAAYLAGSRGVPVKFVPTYEAWVQAPDGARYLNSTHPDNTTTSRLGGVAEDSHPSAEGHIRIADIMWPHLQEEFQRRGFSVSRSVVAARPVRA